MRFTVRRCAPIIGHYLRCDRLVFGKAYPLDRLLREWKAEPGDFPELASRLSIHQNVLKLWSNSTIGALPSNHVCTLIHPRSRSPGMVCIPWTAASAQQLLSVFADTLSLTKEVFCPSYIGQGPFKSGRLRKAVRKICEMGVLC